MMQSLQYPLDFKFKITTIASDFEITDKNGDYLAFVRQKIFKLKDEVQVFSNDSRSQLLYTINANQWIDFNASYAIRQSSGENIGKIARKGMRSLWKATYNIFNNTDLQLFEVSEENVWTKVLDGFIGDIPILGMFTGYFLNPSYVVKNAQGQIVFRLKKMPSFFGRRFQLDRLIDIPDDQETLLVLSLLMMILLERSRG